MKGTKIQETITHKRAKGSALSNLRQAAWFNKGLRFRFISSQCYCPFKGLWIWDSTRDFATYRICANAFEPQHVISNYVAC